MYHFQASDEAVDPGVLLSQLNKALTLSNCVTLDKLLYFSEPVFLICNTQ